MELFNLPNTAIVGRVIPKNAFDIYTTPKQRSLMSDRIRRITWTHKLSPDTVNLKAGEIKEIQVFKVELKNKELIDSLLSVIDKAIPYNIVFIVEHESDVYISTSAKHPHPVNENNAVIDWTFKSDWFKHGNNIYTLVLRNSLDTVYNNLCQQLSVTTLPPKSSLRDLVDHSKMIDMLNKEISKLKSAISNCQQFNKKVELNLKLKVVEDQLRSLNVKP